MSDLPAFQAAPRPRLRPLASLLLAGLAFSAAAPSLFASSYLFYVEAQALAGWSSAAKKAIFYSMMPEDAMQKPSAGFDYVQKFSGDAGDIATLSLQARMALDTEGGLSSEAQIYNAFLKVKTPWADVWAGHNRPAMGLSSMLDNHGTLLQTLSMSGFGYDRDWGLGLERQLEGGDAAISLTTGSGMTLKTGGFLLAARGSLGVLSQDNFRIGASLAFGQTYDAIGIKIPAGGPAALRLVGWDASWVRGAWENGAEIMGGTRAGRTTLALFWRTGLGLLDESRLKIELQPAVFWKADEASYQMAGSATYLATSDLTLRTLVSYDSATKDARILFQVYYYKGIRF